MLKLVEWPSVSSPHLPTLMFKSEFLLCKGLIVPKMLRICDGMMQLNLSVKLRLTGNFVSFFPG